MNYIKQLELDKISLQLDKISLQERLRAVKDEIQSLSAHLNSSKFQGTDPDGSRRDWISVQDVQTRLLQIESAMYE